MALRWNSRFIRHRLVNIDLAFPAKSTGKKFYHIAPTPQLQLALGDGLRWSGPRVIEIPAEQSTAHHSFESHGQSLRP